MSWGEGDYESHFVEHRHSPFSVCVSGLQAGLPSFPTPGDTRKVPCSHSASPKQVSVGLAHHVNFKEVSPFRNKKWKKFKSLQYTF